MVNIHRPGESSIRRSERELSRLSICPLVNTCLKTSDIEKSDIRREFACYVLRVRLYAGAVIPAEAPWLLCIICNLEVGERIFPA